MILKNIALKSIKSNSKFFNGLNVNILKSQKYLFFNLNKPK